MRGKKANVGDGCDIFAIFSFFQRRCEEEKSLISQIMAGSEVFVSTARIRGRHWRSAKADREGTGSPWCGRVTSTLGRAQKDT